jgi:hypothetical protein
VADDKIQRRLKRFLAGKITRENFMMDLSKHAPSPSRRALGASKRQRSRKKIQ